MAKVVTALNSNDVEGNDSIKYLFEKSLTVSGLMGALTFTALIFLLGSKEQFVLKGFAGQEPLTTLSYYYPEILLSALSIISLAFIICTCLFYMMSLKEHSADKGQEGFRLEMPENLEFFTIILWFSSLFALILLIPFLILPFSLIGFIGVIIFEVAILIITIVVSKPEKKIDLS